MIITSAPEIFAHRLLIVDVRLLYDASYGGRHRQAGRQRSKRTVWDNVTPQRERGFSSGQGSRQGSESDAPHARSLLCVAD
jgi:hypothetical protein